jgi:hypothetical protein
VIGNAVHVMRIAAGDITRPPRYSRRKEIHVTDFERSNGKEWLG